MKKKGRFYCVWLWVSHTGFIRYNWIPQPTVKKQRYWKVIRSSSSALRNWTSACKSAHRLRLAPSTKGGHHGKAPPLKQNSSYASTVIPNLKVQELWEIHLCSHKLPNIRRIVSSNYTLRWLITYNEEEMDQRPACKSLNLQLFQKK